VTFGSRPIQLELKIGKLYQLGIEFEYINSKDQYCVIDSHESFVLLGYEEWIYPDFAPILDEYRLKILTKDGNVEYIFMPDCSTLILKE
jgi:hypothetical protein